MATQTDSDVERAVEDGVSDVNVSTEALQNALKSNDTDELISRIVDPSGTEVDPRSQPNASGIVGDTITPGSTGSTFASQNVPDGFAVVVQNDPGNTDNVSIQDDGGTDRHVIEPGGTFRVHVSNLDQINVTGTSNNPSVHATVEAP